MAASPAPHVNRVCASVRPVAQSLPDSVVGDPVTSLHRQPDLAKKVATSRTYAIAATCLLCLMDDDESAFRLSAADQPEIATRRNEKPQRWAGASLQDEIATPTPTTVSGMGSIERPFDELEPQEKAPARRMAGAFTLYNASAPVREHQHSGRAPSSRQSPRR
jgi:hypothetical protein